jgi:hypothetical protein
MEEKVCKEYYSVLDLMNFKVGKRIPSSCIKQELKEQREV